MSKILQECECSCEGCQDMCRRVPCHGTPAEMQRIWEAGYQDRLWVWRQGHNYAIFIRPLPHDRHGYPHTTGQCPFQTKEGLCELHSKGLKPVEGRTAVHKGHPLESAQPKHLRKSLDTCWGKAQGRWLVQRFLQAGGADHNKVCYQWHESTAEADRERKRAVELSREIIL